ncbi:MAG: CRTAC1 family protein [Balneolaceae bacterium]|nr:CRTAC1 family protein [Balneolaceae bacterium]
MADADYFYRGDGEGHFEPIPGQKSGIIAYGDQRGAALSDFNGDGKVDFALSQNAAATKLFLNQVEKQGFSVQLRGPANDSAAISSGIRLVYADGSEGPRRAIQAGGGYWSQNSATQVMGSNSVKPVQSIQVTWSDGSTQEVPITENQNIYQIDY